MKKITIIFSLVLLSLFSFTLSCFATNDWQKPSDIPDLDFTYMEYYVADACLSRDISSFARYLVVIASNSESALDNTTFYTNNTSQHRLSSIVVGSEFVDLFVYKLQADNTWGEGSYKRLSPGADHEVLYGNLSGDYQVFTYIASTKDIIYYPDKSVFFQAPVQEITLAQVLEQNSPIQIFKSQMKNVLVSLTVFLVGFVAFWKAWAWLKTQLHQA